MSKIALICDNAIHDYYSGGYYHARMLAHAVQEAGHELTFFTEHAKIVFDSDFETYKSFNIIEKLFCNLVKEDFADFDLLIGIPSVGVALASKFGKELNKPVYNVMFDFKTILEEFNENVDKRLKADNEIWNFMQRFLMDGNVIVSTVWSVPYLKKWLGDEWKHDCFVIHPSINSRLMTELSKNVKNDENPQDLLMINRNVPFKGFNDVFYAVSELYKRGCKPLLRIITNNRKGLSKLAKKYGIEIEVFIRITDEEKIKLWKKTKLQICGSKYEGYGLWLAEALFMKVPTVCYDLPSLREIANEYDGVYFAEYGDRDDLAIWLVRTYTDEILFNEQKECLKKDREGLSFENMVMEVKEVLK